MRDQELSASNISPILNTGKFTGKKEAVSENFLKRGGGTNNLEAAYIS